MTTPSFRAKILVYLFDKTPIEEIVDTLEFSMNGGFKGQFRCIHGKLKDSYENASIVANLPTYSNSVFISITRSHEKEVALILANLEDYEREHNLKLEAGEVVVTPSPSLSNFTAAPPFATLILRTACSPELEPLLDRHDFEGETVSFFLVMALNESEYNYFKEHGYDALLDHFTEIDKDLFFY